MNREKAGLVILIVILIGLESCRMQQPSDRPCSAHDPCFSGEECIAERCYPCTLYICDTGGVCPGGYRCNNGCCLLAGDGGMSQPDGGSTIDGGDHCPVGMIFIPTKQVCIDKYEASQGPGGKAESKQGATPWVNVNWNEAKAACEAAGKRLCAGDDEWVYACHGPGYTDYPYGNTYDPRACNGRDFWDGGTGYAFPTGSMESCQGGYPGLYDMSGNVQEWTSSCDFDGCWCRSECFMESNIFWLMCDVAEKFHISRRTNFLGFRCCKSL